MQINLLKYTEKYFVMTDCLFLDEFEMAFVLIVKVQAVAGLGGAGRGGSAPSAAPAGKVLLLVDVILVLLLSYPIRMSCCNFHCDLIFSIKKKSYRYIGRSFPTKGRKQYLSDT